MFGTKTGNDFLFDFDNMINQNSLSILNLDLFDKNLNECNFYSSWI